MTQDVETRLDGSTLVIRIPMRFQRRGGRKRIVAPDGSELVPATKPQPDSSLVKALACTSRWQKLLDGASTAPAVGSPGGPVEAADASDCPLSPFRLPLAKTA
jgi:hypothetical protein